MNAKRIFSLVLAFCLCLALLPAIPRPVNAATPNYTVSSAYKSSSYYSALCNVTLTGNQRTDIVNIALSQVGYREGTRSGDYGGADDGSYNNYTEYNYWYHNYVSTGMPVGGDSAPWCATFVSWCAEQANIPTTILKRSTVAGHGASYFKVNFYSGSSTLASNADNDSYFMGYNYTPKAGDLFFTRSWSHVGIVVGVSGSYVITVEGNTNNNGSSQGNGVYRLTSRRIADLYFGVPNYINSSVKHTVNSSYGTNFTAYPKAKITASNIFDANHNQIDSSSWIGTSDKCTIHEVYTDGCCKVTYPLDAGGTKTVFSKISLFNLHTHSYTGSRYYEKAHPHAITQRCVDYDTCGGWTYTGEYYQLKTCEQCWYASFNINPSSVTVNVGESKSVSISLSSYCVPDTITTSTTYDTNIIKLNTQNNSIVITGLNVGSTSIKITVYSDSSKTKVITSVSIPVTVTCTSHSYSYKVTTVPTTSATGKLTGTCTKCSATTTVSLPKLSTSNYTYKVTKAATCTTTGTGRYTWNTTTYGSFYFDVSIAATGHSYTTKVTGPTCTAQGYTTYTCSTCGNSYKDAYTNASGHSYSYKVTKTPTTSATGTITGTCSKCSGTTTVTLPKLSTSNYTYKVTKAATCTAAGTGRYTWNTTTYGSFYFDVSIAATGHSYTTKVTAPTCTAQGYTTYTCSACSNSYRDAYTNATGHNYINGTVIKKATCKEAGTMLYTCSHCGSTQSNSIPKLTTHTYDHDCDSQCNICNATRTISHKYKTSLDKDANSHWQACSVCGNKKNQTAHTPGAAATEASAQVCTDCGYIIQPALSHIHSFLPQLESDENGHWYACTGCVETQGFAAHSFSNDCDIDCADCGYIRFVSHNYTEEFHHDATNHWNACSSCGEHQNTTPHIPGVPATATTAQTCTICGFEISPPLGATNPTSPSTDSTVPTVTQPSADSTVPDATTPAEDSTQTAGSNPPWWIVAVVCVSVVAIVAILAKKKK